MEKEVQLIERILVQVPVKLGEAQVVADAWTKVRQAALGVNNDTSMVNGATPGRDNDGSSEAAS